MSINETTASLPAQTKKRSGYFCLSSVAPTYDFPPYEPRPPWWGPDLQTLCHKIRSPQSTLETFPHQRLILPLGDETGDALVSTLYWPKGRSVGDPFLRTLVILVHGLGGSANTDYMHTAAGHLLENEYPVLNVFLRGVGESGQHCISHNHPGRSEDLGSLLKALVSNVGEKALTKGVIYVGFSMGGNILAKFLGEQPDSELVRGGVTISAPVDLATTSQRLQSWRNVGYQHYLLHHIRDDMLRENIEISQEEREIIRTARSVWEVDEKFSAPHLGFDSVEAYYDKFSSKRYLGSIKLPTVLIHSLNDPFNANEPFLTFPWNENPCLTPIVVRSGGHIGFHSKGSSVPWHDRCVVKFLEAL